MIKAMLVHKFTVGHSRFEFMLPEVVRRGQRIVIDDVEFVVAEDGVIHHARDANVTWVTAPLTTEYGFNLAKEANNG